MSFNQAFFQTNTADLTPLMRAVSSGEMNTVSALITSKVDVNAQTESGATALLFAIHNNQLDIAKKLLKNGAGLNTLNAHGVNALLYALEQADYNAHCTPMVEMLINYGGELEPLLLEDIDFIATSKQFSVLRRLALFLLDQLIEEIQLVSQTMYNYSFYQSIFNYREINCVNTLQKKINAVIDDRLQKHNILYFFEETWNSHPDSEFQDNFKRAHEICSRLKTIEEKALTMSLLDRAARS